MIVYTAITNNRDNLKDNQNKTGVDEFISFLDKPIKSETWNFKKIPTLFNDPIRNAKIVKILSHKFIESEYSLWIDGTMILYESLPNLISQYLNDCDLAIFKHPWNTCLYKEGFDCINLNKDNKKIIEEQLNFYRKENIKENLGLPASGMILRRHTKKVIEFNNYWWSEICKYSRRDQISFMYAIDKTNLKFNFFKKNYKDKTFVMKGAHN